MNFSRTNSKIHDRSAIIGTANPVSNRFAAAMLATFAALIISVFGSAQWASADSGTTSPAPGSDPVPGAPTDVTAHAGDEVAAVSWLPAANSVSAYGYIVTSDPANIAVEVGENEFLVRVPGLENGVEYTFTVVAFNENGRSDPSDVSNAVTPSANDNLDDDELRRLHRHLREKAAEARQRFKDAEKRALENLDTTRDRAKTHLDEETDRAHEFVEKTREIADRRNEHEANKARTWYDHLQTQLAEKLERAIGTERYEQLRERSTKTLEKASKKVDNRLENSKEQTDARVDKAEEKARERVEKATERAENVIGRTEERLTEHVSGLRDRLHELLLRLRTIWAERANAAI